MAEPISSVETKPKYFTAMDDPPTPLSPKPSKPAVDLDYPLPTAPTAAFKAPPGSPPSLANVDVSTWPTKLLEQNVGALSKRLATTPSSVTAADREHLAKMEGELSGRYAKEKAPTLQDVSKPTPKVELCKRPADLPGNDLIGGALRHHWLRTSHVEVGMGPAGGGVPGHAGGNNGSVLGKTTLNDHKGQGDLIDASCEILPDVDEACVEERLKLGTDSGRWAPPLNDCHTVAAKIVKDCKVKP